MTVGTPMIDSRTADLIHLFINNCKKVRNNKQLHFLIKNQLAELLPHEYAFCSLSKRGGIFKEQIYSLEFSGEHLDALKSDKRITNSVILKRWCTNPRAIFFNDQFNLLTLDPSWEQFLTTNMLKNILVHGLVDMLGNYASFLFLAKCPSNWDERHKRVIEVIMPHIHVAITRLAAKHLKRSKKMSVLTLRETEILKWMYAGKTNPEIACILKISTSTVKNHIHSILDKLSAANRAHAVAKAVNDGMLSV